MTRGARGGMNDLLAAALAYAARGWFVFPCNLDKTPATEHGVKDATTDPALIRRWWSAKPAASIGLACGPSHLVVIDIDAGKGGFESWAALMAAHGIPDETLTSITGGGGRHYIYRAPDDFHGKNSAGKLGPGVDVRANGGYIIAPPSGHPSGNVYVWDSSWPEPLLLPDSLRPLLGQRPLLERKKPAPAPVTSTIKPSGPGCGYAAAALRAELGALGRAVEGARNHTLNAAAFSLGQLVAGKELDRSEVERDLLTVALHIGLSEREALATIRSGLDSGAREPRTAPEPTPRTATACAPPSDPPDWPDNMPQEPAWLNDDQLAERIHTPQTAQDPAKRITLLTAKDALTPRPARQWLIDRLLLPGSVNVLYAPPGTGKTYTFTDMSVCVATGAPWLGLPTKQGAVLIIDEESGRDRILDRLAEVLRGHVADETTPVYIATLAGFNFRDAASLAALQELIKQVDARLVIIDALADVMLGGDENAVKDTQPVFHGLRMVAEATGAAILVVHHSNRGGTYRGSSAIPGAVDVMLELTRQNDSQIVNVATAKNRDGEPLKLSAAMRWTDGCFDLVPVPTAKDPVPALPANSKSVTSKSQRYVMRYLTEHVTATIEEIMTHADSCTPDTARHAVYELADKRKVRRCDQGHKGDSATYELVKSGDNEQL